MRSLALVTLLTLGASIAPARADQIPMFADIPWGAQGGDVVKAATAAGLHVVKQDDDGDYEFSGELFGAPAVVYAFMSPDNGLVKVQVRLAAPDDKPLTKYAEVVGDLTARYGKTEQVELFKAPYKKGDGLADEAVREGKGLVLSAWGDDREPGQASLVVRVTKLVVGLDYESHGWTAELSRRKEQASTPTGPRVAETQPSRNAPAQIVRG